MKNIILDMGNVLLDYDPEVPLEEFCSEGEERDLIRKELFEGPEWLQGDLGYMDVEDKYNSIRKRIPPQYHRALRSCLDRWHQFMPPVEGAHEFIRKALAAGYDLYILSNASDEFYLYFPKHYNMEVFKGIVVSSDLHMVKPDPEIYRYLLEKYHCRAEESCFIDDRSENVQAAEELNIRGILFKNNYGEVEKMLGLQ